jgi:hypothetical protein
MKFYRTPLQELLLAKKVSEDKELYEIFRKKKYINSEMDYEFKSRTTGIIDNFITILITGEQGTIKSGTGQAIVQEKIQPEFTAKQISFLYEDFKKMLGESKPGETFILDEQVFMHGTGSIRIIDEIQSIIETLRKRRNSMILIAVEDKYFPEEIFTFTLETIDNTILGTCPFHMKLHEIRTCKEFNEQDHHIEKIIVRLAVKKKMQYIGLYTQEIIWNNQIWLDYSKKKDEFLELAKIQKFGKIDYENLANEILRLPESALYQKTKEIKLLLEKLFPNLTIGEKELITAQIRINRKQEQGDKKT